MVVQGEDSIYDANLDAIVDAVLYGRSSDRAEALLHRLRLAVTHRTRDPTVMIDAGSLLRSFRFVDPAASTFPRHIPLNSLDVLDTQAPKPLCEVTPHNVDWNLSESHHNRGLFPKCSKRRLSSSEHGDDPYKSKEYVDNFVADTWQRFSRGGKLESHSNNVKQPIRSNSATNDCYRSNPNHLRRFFQSASIDDVIFIGCVLGDGTTNMDEKSAAEFSDDARELIFFAYSLSGEEILPPNHFSLTEDDSYKVVIRDFLHSRATKVAYDLKRVFRCIFDLDHSASDILQVSKLGGLFVDVKLAVWLLHAETPGEQLSFHALSLHLSKINKGTIQQRRTKSDASVPGMDNLSKLATQYEIVSKELSGSNQNLLNALGIESCLAIVLAKMESDGIEVDVSYLQSQRAAILGYLTEIEKTCHLIAGCEFNLSSPDQVAHILFDKLGLEVPATLASGHRSTAERALESLESQHEMPGLVIKHRGLSKLIGTYVDPLIIANRRVPGIIQTSWNQTACATGRLSSSGPNLQSLPKAGTVLGDGPGLTSTHVNIRNTFICTEQNVFVAADYKQMEVRVFAILSTDPALNQAIEDACDVYQVLASVIFQKSSSEISLQEKSQAKTIFLALMYGMGPTSLSKQLSLITKKEHSILAARSFSKQLLSQFPRLQEFVSTTIEFCRRHGYVETITGRRRYLPDIASSDPLKRNAAERQAVNTLIQGSSSDIMKRAMVEFLAAIDSYPFGKDVKLRLQIHDEIVLTCPANKCGTVCRVLVEAMQRNVVLDGIGGQLQVSVKTGNTLGNMHEWPLHSPPIPNTLC